MKALFSIFALLMLTACGQKGSLYLPSDMPSQSPTTQPTQPDI